MLKKQVTALNSTLFTKKQIILEDRADPVIHEMQLRSNVGYERVLTELDSTCLCFLAFSDLQPKTDYGTWHWCEGEQTTVHNSFREAAIRETFSGSIAVDYDFNQNGIRRFAIPILNDRELTGILAVAQRQTPRAHKESKHIQQALRGLSAEVARVA